MKRAGLFVGVLFATWFTMGAAFAIPTISLVPSSGTVSPSGSFFIDINISGLQSSGTDAVVGAFDLDLLYDPSLFSPVIAPPTGFGLLLGDISLSEASGGIDASLPGTVSLFEVSLLTPAELDALQDDSFTLATIGFMAISAGGTSGVFSTSDVIVSDDLGDPLSLASPTATATVRIVAVPEPGMFLMLLVGAFGLLVVAHRRFRRDPSLA